MEVQPYLNSDGRCEEAIEFYHSAVGAEVILLVRNKENPNSLLPNVIPPEAADKILHVSLRIGDSTVMASDGMCQSGGALQGITLSLSAADEAEAKRLFTALSNGGQVRMPMAKTFFSPAFGMVNDRFGVPWMVIVPA